MTVGKIDDDGTVHDRSFTTIGKVDDDGTIHRGNMMIIGQLPNVNKSWAAVGFFFFNFDMS
jgi:hypothetical protein